MLSYSVATAHCNGRFWSTTLRGLNEAEDNPFALILMTELDLVDFGLQSHH